MKKYLKILIVLIIILISISVIRNIIGSKYYQYEITQVENYTYFKYKEDDSYGVIDRNGNIIIQPAYETIIIPNPDKDIFVCSNGETNTILNSSSEELFTEYDNIEAIKIKNTATILCYEKSVLKYEKDGKYGLIDFDGNELTKNIYDSIDNLLSTQGKFIVSSDEKYGIINLNGKVLVDLEYDEIQTDQYYNEETGYTKAGFIVSIKNDDGYKYGYINYKGKTILDTEYNDIIRITTQEDIYLIAATNGQYGLYKNSKELLSPEYQSIIACDNNALIIQKNANYGIANLQGDIIVDISYSSIEEKGIYLYATSSNANKIYDENGNIIDMNFSKTIYTTDNDEYMISTLVNNDITYYGIENSSGDTLLENSYNYIEYAFGDYFIAKDDDGNFGVIKYNGNVIIDFKYSLIQKTKNKNILQVIDTDTNITTLYSSSLSTMCEMENATIINEDNYLEIYNDDETKYFDAEGNELNEDSELLYQNIPDMIGEYSAIQLSLDDVYYE